MTRKFLLGICMALLTSTAFAVDFATAAYDCAPNHSVFATGFQRFARLKNNDGGADTRYNPTAGALGYIYKQNNWYAGAAVSYEHGTRKYDERGGNESYRVRSNMPGISAYGGFSTPDGWYVDTTAFMGFGTFKARNLRVGGASQGTGNGVHKTVYAVSLEGGKEFTLGNGLLVTPHVGIDYSYTPSEHYRFNGWDNNIDSQSYFEIPVGVRFAKLFDCGNWDIMPRVDLTVVNSIGGMDTMNDQPGFAYRTAKSWRVAGVGGDHIGGRITAGVDARLNNRTTLGLDYTYEGRKDYNDHRISAMLGWSF